MHQLSLNQNKGIEKKDKSLLEDIDLGANELEDKLDEERWKKEEEFEEKKRIEQ